MLGLCAAWGQYSPLPAPGYPGLITVMRPGVGQRVFSGNTGLTNAFYGATNGDIITVGPGTYTIKAYKNSTGQAIGGLQVGATAAGQVRDLTINGYGATIRTTNYGTMLSMIGVSNVMVEGLTFVGNLTDITNYTNASFTLEGAIVTYSNAASQVHNVRIKNCSFIEIPDQAISWLWGGAINSEVDGCKFLGIGRSNNLAGGSLPDGSCVSGVMFGGRVINCTASNVMTFFEWDGMLGPPNVQCDGLLVSGNQVDGIYNYGVLLVAGAYGNSVQGLNVAGNWFRVRPGYEMGSLKAMLFSDGSFSNSVIRGNTFVGGGPYIGQTNFQIYLSDTVSSIKNLIITDNSFRDSQAQAIRITQTVAGWDNITITGNNFSRVYFPICLVNTYGVIVITANTFQSWASGVDYGGNNIGTCYVMGTCSNIVYSANIHIATNAACKTVTKWNYDPWMTYENNRYFGVPMTYCVTNLWPTHTNMFFVESGPGGWTNIAVRQGSIFLQTDATTAGNLLISTNSAGLKGWRVQAN